MLHIINLYFFYFIFIFSSIGYGYILTYRNQSLQKFDLGFVGLSGIFTLIVISYITNYFFAHDYLHNSLIFIIGIISFFYFSLKNFKKYLIEFKILFLIFSILFIGILLYKNHDDFFYYHFQYTLSIIEFKKIIGLGLLEHGYRTPSSIFYLNSLFYLPGIDYYFLNGGAILILGFSDLYLINKIFKRLKDGSIDTVFYILLLSLTLINTSFYRISEHGTDRSSLILIFLFSTIYLESINVNRNFLKNNLKNFYEKLIIILGLIVSFKSFYLIYSIFLFSWFFELKNIFIKKNILINNVLKNHITYLSILLIGLVLITMYLNTGCLIYPASFTCIGSFEWSIKTEEVIKMKEWYELWSKAGATPNLRVDNPQEYLVNFNWVSNWISTYFFTKVSDYILVLIFISLIFYLIIKNKFPKKNKIKFRFQIFYIFLLLLFLEWFINHPALRYGGYSLIALLIFLPLSFYLSKFSQNKKQIIKKFYLILSIIIFVFLLKNIQRIFDENKKYGYNPLINPYYNIISEAFEVNKLLKRIEENYKYSQKLIILDRDIIERNNK